ncbi:DUF4174 domain-containing protein [Aestuariivita boseongensis]|uniref:DUF4174 domain-containing protein n=1 Tax=Aestuariivita boseongensis TaxID=1470562 RepID=UPI0006813F28|nr:DUF4174 domain-containing protein [Aestuariivita boseongensis]
MKNILAVVLAVLFPLSAMATDASSPQEFDMIRSAEDVDLSEFLWIKRPVIVFADTPADPRYAEQIEYLTERLDDLRVRDVVVLTDTDPSQNSALRQKLRPRGFMLVLIGKDGTVYLRKPFPWSVRELSRSIDKMPMRQREIRERRGDG